MRRRRCRVSPACRTSRHRIAHLSCHDPAIPTPDGHPAARTSQLGRRVARGLAVAFCIRRHACRDVYSVRASRLAQDSRLTRDEFTHSSASLLPPSHNPGTFSRHAHTHIQHCTTRVFTPHRRNTKSYSTLLYLHSFIHTTSAETETETDKIPRTREGENQARTQKNAKPRLRTQIESTGSGRARAARGIREGVGLLADYHTGWDRAAREGVASLQVSCGSSSSSRTEAADPRHVAILPASSFVALVERARASWRPRPRTDGRVRSEQSVRRGGQ